MPGSAGSSWYFLRYIDPKNDKEFADKKLVDHWMPVDLYVGGPEHAVGHLLYSRMWNRFLYDNGYISNEEPFTKLVHQGMILGENGIKMGKRFPKYVVNPSDIVRDYGADTLRLYEMFMGPLEADKPWNNDGVVGAKKFLERVFRLYMDEDKIVNSENKNLEKIYHKTVKKVTLDYESLDINTAISQMMIFVNAVNKEEIFPLTYAEGFLKLLNPLCPHITEELWCEKLGHKNTISYEQWPEYDESKLADNEIEVPIQINGKLKATVNMPVDCNEEVAKGLVHQNKNIESLIDGKTIIKEIFVKNKIYNIVVK